MMRYVSCSKILEDIRILRICGRTVIFESWEYIERFFDSTLNFKKVTAKVFFERLTRRSECLTMRDDKGGGSMFCR